MLGGNSNKLQAFIEETVQKYSEVKNLRKYVVLSCISSFRETMKRFEESFQPCLITWSNILIMRVNIYILSTHGNVAFRIDEACHTLVDFVGCNCYGYWGNNSPSFPQDSNCRKAIFCWKLWRSASFFNQSSKHSWFKFIEAGFILSQYC